MPSKIITKLEAKGDEKNQLNLVAESSLEWLSVEAAGEGEKQLKKFKMLAYTGGRMNPSRFYRPVVVDLSGAKLANKTIPILRDHDPSRIVGHGQVQITDKNITAEGVISFGNEYAKEVVESSANGFPWQASIGASILEMDVLSEKETAIVNGQSVKGPALIARKVEIYEISFVPLGADKKTSAKVTASNKGADAMGFEQWLEANGFDPDTLDEKQRKALEAAFKAETGATESNTKPATEKTEKTEKNPLTASRSTETVVDEDFTQQSIKAHREAMGNEMNRVAAIEKVCAGFPDIKAKAVTEGWDESRAELEVLRASRPPAPSVHTGGISVTENVLECAVLQATGYGDLEGMFDDKTLQAAHTAYRGRVGLQELILECAGQNGYAGRRSYIHDPRAILQAAFSTNAIGGILSNTANKYLKASFDAVESVWRMFAEIKPVKDFKTITGYRMNGDLTFQELGAGGEIKHGSLGEETFSNKAGTFARMLTLTREDLINDDLGALATRATKLGRGGATGFNIRFWKTFLNNATFFTGERGNYFDGAGSPLDSDSLSTAVKMFRNMKDADGHPLALMPKKLLVPPSLETTADELYASTNFNTGGSSTKTKVPNKNTHAGKYKPEVSAYLEDTTLTGNSTTAWYLFADNADLAPVEVVFLNGVQNPTVESADADFNVLGIQLRGYFDFGMALSEYRAGVKSLGTTP